MNSENLLPCIRKPKRSSCLTIALILLSSFLVLVDVSDAASRQRYENFESYALGNMTAGQRAITGYWTDDSGRITPDIVSSSLDGLAGPHGGSKMARFNYDTLNSATGWSSLQQNPTGIAFTNEIFYRYWIRFDKDYGASSIGSERKFGRIFTTSPVYNDLFLEVAPSEFITVVLVNGSYPGVQHSIALSITAWNKVEFYINRSTGTVKLWVNNALKENYTGLNTAAGRWVDFYPASNWGDVENSGWRHGSNNHFYFDDLEIYSDVGTGATGSMSDATITAGGSAGITPPMAPVNLRVQ